MVQSCISKTSPYMNSSSPSDATGATGAGGVISARFAAQEQAEKAVTDLKSASFSGSDIGIVPHDREAEGGVFGEPRKDAPRSDTRGATVTVSARARVADAERILRAAGGTVESTGGSGASSPATADVIAPGIHAGTRATDMHVSDKLIRPPQPPNEGSGRLLS